MRVLVTYFSRTGNTKKIAEAIYDEIQTEKEIKTLDEIESLEGYDFAFVGFPMEGYGPSEQIKEVLEKTTKGRRIALFVTHGAPEEAPNLQGWLANCRGAVAKADLVDMFDCQGRMSDAIVSYMAKSDNPEVRRWAEMYVPNDQPDESRVERARDFARDVMKKVSK